MANELLPSGEVNMERASEWGYEDICDVMDLNRNYLLGSLDKDACQTVKMTERVFAVLRERVPGFCGGFGIGFPYHSLGKDGIAFQPEFDRYHRQVNMDIARAALMHPVWECGSCQQSDHFDPDMCSECTISSLKPRRIMKAASDLDTFVVIDEVDQLTLDTIWQVAQQEGFSQSDHDTVGSLKRVQTVLQSFSDGQQPDEYLPIDLHVMSKEDFIQMCDDISTGALAVSPTIWSMYAKWKKNVDIDVWFDMVFSSRLFTESTDQDITLKYTDAMSGLAARYDTNFLIDRVAERSVRASVLLQEPEARNILEGRINSWRNLNT